MPQEAFDLLQPSMQRVELPLRHELVAPNLPAQRVYFLESGLGSLVANSSDNESVEAGHIGYEGMAGAHVVLKIDMTPNGTFMQVEGAGIAVPTTALLSVLEQVPAANDLLLRYVHCCELQLAQSTLANARYNMHERLARWLLMCHDRLSTPVLPLTHEFLALMLGVRRSGVTNEIHVIEGIGAIKASRGAIKIINRKKLEDIAGGCYGMPESEYERFYRLASTAIGRQWRGLRLTLDPAQAPVSRGYSRFHA
jgi:CRP-like cAMP-binding protein